MGSKAVRDKSLLTGGVMDDSNRRMPVRYLSGWRRDGIDADFCMAETATELLSPACRPLRIREEFAQLAAVGRLPLGEPTRGHLTYVYDGCGRVLSVTYGLDPPYTWLPPAVSR